ncbi:MAG TPA: large conductance mechanosensitive channel protein MscL [Anaerolineae bacterium]|nr:large conductance mechanosensitive channel protein MscL [Anaerolineae bacterium]
MWAEFRQFIAKGNVIDLAVAVILGAAFTAIVTSLTNDIIMPLIGVLLGGVDFATLSIQVGEATIAYGLFIQAIINFILIALVLFFMIRSINKMQARSKKEEAPAPPPGPSDEVKLLTDIRELLKQR